MNKTDFAAFVIGVCAILQGIAWYLGLNGAVSGAIMGIIGLTAGSILGFTWKIAQVSAENYRKDNPEK